MGFRDNLLKKIKIKELTNTVIDSAGPSDSGRRYDLNAMRRLLELGDYPYQKERDLDLYTLPGGQILALDNELKIFSTTAQDIGLRKSPTIKEMVSIRNAIKILNDKNVVVSAKGDTVLRVQKELLSTLDLSFTAGDIASLARDGAESLKNGYAEGVMEILKLFAELLDFRPPPKSFQVAHHQIWGHRVQPQPGQWQFGPLVMFNLMHNTLKMLQNAFNNTNKADMSTYQQVVQGERPADLTDDKVWLALQKAVLKTD